ncbi:MAG: metallophosphoesterase [Christensenellaceae bacterium]|jgi:predicted phosphohydrolase|nr:metallophosphoesterase [Christensenellaceae bacterium]
MKIFALSDFHLSFSANKPMDLFGDHWMNYENEIQKNWNAMVGDDDIGIIAGDLSWAMKMEDTKKDFDFIHGLKGTKIIIRGNHDYYWKSISKLREFVQPDILVLQNDSIKIGDFVFAGSRGWHTPERRQFQTDEDKKIYSREIIRFELSLQDALKKMDEKSKLIAILHYPPFNCARDDSPFTELCEKYKVSAVIYGHLHGKGGRPDLELVKNGIKYYLTSTDLLLHKPVKIDII